MQHEYKYLDNIEVPPRVEGSVSCVIGVKIGGEVLDEAVGVLLLIVELVIPLIKC